MRRFPLNPPTLLPLLLCVALWVFSYFYYDAVGVWPSPARRRVYGLVSSHGTLCLMGVGEGNGTSWWAWKHQRGGGFPSRLEPHAGFVLRRDAADWIVGVPYWALCVVFSSVAVARLARDRKGRRPGVCQSCGYDLRATPERCPECGALVAR